MSWPLSVKHAAKITFAQRKCRTFQSIIYPADKNIFIGISSILAWGKSRVDLPPPFIAIKNLNSYLYMLINGRHTYCLHVPFLFHWQIYGQQSSSTSSPRDKRKKAEWTSKKQTSVDDVKNKTSILNRITIVFHHCLFNLNISVETNYIWVWWFVWNTRSFPQRSYLEKCVSNTISPVLQTTARCLL